jgi:hypothetical protein
VITASVFFRGGEVFRTKDLNLATAISVLSGADPGMEADRLGKVVFCFNGETDVHKTLIAYHDGAVAPLVDFVERFKTLKASMYSRREVVRQRWAAGESHSAG